VSETAWIPTPPGPREKGAAAAVALALGVGVGMVSYWFVRTILSREEIALEPPTRSHDDEGTGRLP
jgi:hypothetical protein